MPAEPHLEEAPTAAARGGRAAARGAAERPAGRTACSDAERRAALAVAAELEARGRRPEVATRWVRRGATFLALLAAALGVAGSVVLRSDAILGTALAGGGLLLLLLDAAPLTRPLVRALLPARATQTVLAPPPAAPGRGAVELLLTVRGDVPARSLADRGAAAAIGVERALAAGLLVLAATGGFRIGGRHGLGADVVQMVATVVVLVAGALLVDRAAAQPTAEDERAADAAVAAALAALDRLDADPPRRVAVTFAVTGAGALTLRPLLRELLRGGGARSELAVLELAPTRAARTVWWTRAGRVVPLRFHPSLLAAAARTAQEERALGATAAGGAPADLPARVARSMRVGALAVGVPAGAAPDGAALALGVVRGLDDELSRA